MRLPGSKILIVEDDEAVRDPLADLLSVKGHQVIAVGSAEEGLEQLRAGPVAFIISDCSLPGRDGVWLLAEAERAGHPRSRMVMVTANREVSGVADIPVLRKPLGAAELIAFIEPRLAPTPAPPPLALRRHFAAAAWQRARPALALALAATLLLAVEPTAVAPPPGADGFGARGSAPSGSTFGVRAFCIQRDGARVLATAAPGEALECPYGSALQFTYTAPLEARLRIRVAGTDSWLFDDLGRPAAVGVGVDVPLPASTLVDRGWLNEPLALHAEFTDRGSGALLSTSVIQLQPVATSWAGADGP